jgi:hypothetical protein
LTYYFSKIFIRRIIMAETPSGSDIQKILAELNTMKAGALACVIILVIAVIAYLAWRHWLDYKKQLAMEENKKQRAKDYVESMQTLSNSIRSHANEENVILERINGTMETVNETMSELKQGVSKLDQGVSVLIAKTNGVINKEDSSKIIRDRFFNHVYHSFCTVIEHSLRVNNYDKDKDMIIMRVKLAMNKDMTAAREYLHSFVLAIDYSKFFVCACESTDCERFLLVDQVWTIIEPLYKIHDVNMDTKIENAFALIESTIIKYIGQCANENDINMEFRKTKTSATLTLLERTTRLMSHDK